MNLRKLTSSLVLLATLSLSGAASAETIVNVEALFNSGLHMGWLVASFDTGLFPSERPTYAYWSTKAFNDAFSPSPGWDVPALTRQDASFRWTHQEKKVRWSASQASSPVARASYAIMDAGFQLGYAHINAQKGTCPGCVQKALERAGLDLQGTRIPALVSLGGELISTARNMRPTSVAELQAYTGYLASAINAVQGIL